MAGNQLQPTEPRKLKEKGQWCATAGCSWYSTSTSEPVLVLVLVLLVVLPSAHHCLLLASTSSTSTV
jgi:hypothetical protein